MEYNITDFLTDTSRNKLNLFKDNNLNTNIYGLRDFFDIVYQSFKKKLVIKNLQPLNIAKIRQLFKDFDKNFNHVEDSNLTQELYDMECIYSIEMDIRGDKILLNIICHDKSDNIIPAIVHAIHTFCYSFPYNYDGLEIYTCLDNNKRQFHEILDSGGHTFQYLQKNSMAFTVSAVTKRMNKIIMTTKTEDVIKLLFHELVHYIGLDHELLTIQAGNYGFNIDRENLNLSEGYTEFMSILINSAYHAIHLSYILQKSAYDIFQYLLCVEIEYSVYLTANILRFYGYNQNNFINFFEKSNISGDIKMFSPIPIWEYIILRTQLLLNMSKLIKSIKNDWRINEKNRNAIVNLMKINKNFMDKLKIIFETTDMCNNISYTIVDFNWNSAIMTK